MKAKFKLTRSSAVAVIADCTAFNTRYTYRLLAGTVVVSMSIYLFTVSNWSLLLKPVSILADSCFVTKRHTVQQKCLKKWIGSAALGTWQYNFQSRTLTLNASIHFVTDRQTYSCPLKQYHANSRQYCVQHYDHLKAMTLIFYIGQIRCFLV